MLALGRSEVGSILSITAAECELMLRENYAELLRYADALPTGRKDKLAQAKLEHELAEFDQALSIGDEIGAYTEIADIVYYCAKAVSNQLLTKRDVSQILASACLKLECTPADAFMSSIIKYHLRAEVNQDKNDKAEREAISAYLAR